jgi:hypothetical protein
MNRRHLFKGIAGAAGAVALGSWSTVTSFAAPLRSGSTFWKPLKVMDLLEGLDVPEQHLDPDDGLLRPERKRLRHVDWETANGLLEDVQRRLHPFTDLARAESSARSRGWVFVATRWYAIGGGKEKETGMLFSVSLRDMETLPEKEYAALPQVLTDHVIAAFASRDREEGWWWDTRTRTGRAY